MDRLQMALFFDIDDTLIDHARDAGLQGIWLDRRGVVSRNQQGPFIQSLEELADLVAAC